ncbi:MAG: DUF2089 domain-containing protein [Tissierellales bacterium]
MRREMIGKCPICGEELSVTRLTCPSCNTTIEGNFSSCKFCKLTNEQKLFVEIFIKNRGNIKEIEKEMGISYPTVRNKLDEIIKALGYSVDTSPEDSLGERRKEILAMLEKGEINSQEAIKMLKNL